MPGGRRQRCRQERPQEGRGGSRSPAIIGGFALSSFGGSLGGTAALCYTKIVLENSLDFLSLRLSALGFSLCHYSDRRPRVFDSYLVQIPEEPMLAEKINLGNLLTPDTVLIGTVYCHSTILLCTLLASSQLELPNWQHPRDAIPNPKHFAAKIGGASTSQAT